MNAFKVCARVFLLAAVSAVLLILTLPPGAFSLCSWLALVPLLFLAFNRQRYSLWLIVLGFLLTGAVSYLYVFSWILKFEKRIFFLVWPLCTLLFPLYGLLLALLLGRVKNMLLQVLVVPAVWILLLKLFSFTYIGYHWGEQFWAYGQSNLYLLQLVSVLGTTGLTFLILLYNGSLYVLLARRNLKAVILFILCNFIVITTVFLGYKYVSDQYRLPGSGAFLSLARYRHFLKGADTDKVERPPPPDPKSGMLRPLSSASEWFMGVVVVQPGSSGEPGFEHVDPDVRYDDIWIPCIQKGAIQKSQFMAFCVAAQKRYGPDLIVWPQYNLLFDVSGPSEMVDRFYSRFETPILVGTFIRRNDKLVNICVLFDEHGKLIGSRTLATPPPFRKVSMSYQREFKPVTYVSNNKRVVIGPLLCYEDTSAEGARALVRNGARMLVVQTNNEAFQETRLPEMHLRRDVFRALENRRWLVRAATTGISAVITSRGEITRRSKVAEQDMIPLMVPANSELTFFTRYGDWTWLFSLVILLGAVLSRPKRSLGQE